MNGTEESARKLAKKVVEGTAGLPATVVICPPAIHIPYIATITKSNAVQIGGQDCHYEESGAFTGNISAKMLKELACEFVIVGHSERRAQHAETNEMVRKKAEAALKQNLRVILCVGETIEERKSGKAKQVVEKQVKESMPKNADDYNVVIAYEPVWAIGTGEVATVADIKEMHLHIIRICQHNLEKFANSKAKVLYGGSVKSTSAAEILQTEGVGGVLVGGASLIADEFINIAKAAR